MSDELPFRECDLCGQVLDEDEELEPVFVGSPPEQKSRRNSETVKECDKRVGNSDYRGRRFDYYVGLDKVVENMDGVQARFIPQVMETDFQRMEDVGNLKRDPKATVTFDQNVREDLVAVELVVEPDLREPEPDLRVCEFCRESLQEESESQ